jgi:hypothetical protein
VKFADGSPQRAIKAQCSTQIYLPKSFPAFVSGQREANPWGCFQFLDQVLAGGPNS